MLSAGLRYLQIRNVAIIDELELEVGPGMTVFTGETGAGKSILIEALGLVLGDRADSTMVRAGCDQASVSAIFIPPDDGVFRRTLDEHGIDWAEEVLIRRQLGVDGRSRAFVNGAPAPVQVLRGIGERLADIHGQHEHHSLLRRDAQRELLDAFSGHEGELDAIGSAYARARELEQALTRLQGLEGGTEREVELLRYHIGELRAAQPTTEGIAAVEEEHRRLSNAGRILEACRNALAALSDEEASALARVDHGCIELRGVTKIDSRFSEVTELLDTAGIQIREAERWLRHYAERLEADPGRIQQLELQIATLHEFARKHNVRPEQLPELLGRLEERLQELEGGEERRQQLRGELKEARSRYQDCARTLHEARQRGARKLAHAVTGNMHQLGMPGGKFSIEVEALGEDAMASHGSDRIEFLVSANPGQPLKPLTKVASGGELSRISLAIQVLSAQGKGVPTFVFDEVDVGIGGRVAEIVGRMLRELGRKGQVLCVTHLPQVAALGHDHVQITKTVANDQTRIALARLHADSRVNEIARMLGGLTITSQTIAHARSLLTQAGAIY
ncbi:MAG: DNA repair protein RecN [Chromatiales bacterium]